MRRKTSTWRSRGDIAECGARLRVLGRLRALMQLGTGEEQLTSVHFWGTYDELRRKLGRTEGIDPREFWSG